METLGKEGLYELGFDIPMEGGVMAWQALALNKVEKELPSASDIGKADDNELQEIMKMQPEAWEISSNNSKDPRICPCTNS